MPCRRCTADPTPEGLAEPRRCAFPEGRADETVVADNWQCGTLNALRELCRRADKAVYGYDATLYVLPVEFKDDGGFVVLASYKERGQVASAYFLRTDGTLLEALTLGVASKTVRLFEKTYGPVFRD
jgi:hypothetical protein